LQSNGNHFNDLDFGIYADNSNLISIDNTFSSTIGLSINDAYDPQPFTWTGIYSNNAPTISIGISNNFVEVHNNFFTMLKRGIFINKNTNVRINNALGGANVFNECKYAAVEITGLENQTVDVSGCDVVGLNRYGLRFIDCVQMSNFRVRSNNISMTPNVLPNSLASTKSYFNTGIFCNNRLAPVNTNALLDYNSIIDARIGIALLNYSQFSISYNRIKLDRLPNQLNGFLHQGIEVNNSNFGRIDWNNILYSGTYDSTTSTSNYKNLFLGLNLKGFTNSELFKNVISRTGTGIRFVGSNALNRIWCNTMDECELGWKCESSVLSPIGSPGKPFENKFTKFSGRDRSAGTNVLVPADLYFPGNEMDFNNVYTAWPYSGTNIIVPFPNQPFNDICSGIATPEPNEDFSYMEKVIMDSINYPYFYEVLHDKDVQAAYARYRSAPDSSYDAYLNWFEELENGRIGLTSRLIEPFINLDSIRILLSGLADEESQEFNQLRELIEITLYNLEYPDNAVPYDTSLLYQLAFMDEWNGTQAVYIARAILEIEVNDFMLGLRTMNSPNDEIYNCSDLLLFFNDFIVIPDKSNKMKLEYFDKLGRIIYSEESYDDIDKSKINRLKTQQVFIIRASQNSCTKSYKLP